MLHLGRSLPVVPYFFYSGLDCRLRNYPALSYRHLGAFRLFAAAARKLVAGSLFEYGNAFDPLFLSYISLR